jgi:GT2 family glycosyltransferase
MFHNELGHDVLEIIIVDNKSPDDSITVIREDLKKNNCKNVTLLAAHSNLGFGKGCNYAAGHAKGKYLLFLNNDTVVKDKGILKMTTFLSRHPEVAVLGGRLLNPDGSQQPSTGNFYTPINVSLMLMGLQNFGIIDKIPESTSEVDWVKGALFMIKKHIFRKVGGFDGNIFMYIEDMELCYRIKQAGYKMYYYPDTYILHEHQGSSSRAFAIVNIYKNLLYFYKKHRSPLEYYYVKTLMKSKAAILYAYGRIADNKYFIHTYEKAFKVS